MMKILPLLCALGLIPSLLHADSPLLEIDFSDDFSRQESSSGDAGQVQVVDGVSIPGGVFNEQAGAVLALEKGPDHERIPRSTWGFEPTTSGVLSFKAYAPIEESFHSPLLNVFLFQDSLNLIGPSFYVSQESIHVRDGEAWRVYEGAWDNSTLNEVAVEFFEDQTYRVLINGTALGSETHRFRFHIPETQIINRVQFAVASTTIFASRVYVDDVSIKPLPAR